MNTQEVLLQNLIETLAAYKDRGFLMLMDLTAVDYVTHAKLIYLLHNPTNYKRMFITTTVARGISAPSATTLWEGADWYERELYDLFGIHFEGHNALTRILMPDDWKGHPLQKDYALTEEPVAFKHGVQPKIPSEIIPHVS